MQRDCAHEARQRKRYPGVRTGFRRLTPGLLAADHAAEDFKGLPGGIKGHGELLAAFKAAAFRLGLSVRLVHALDWLFRFTQAQDWEQGRRPVVWPSAATQQEAFGLSQSGVRSINRHLVDAGLITMRDSPNGKRYGMRDRHGQIVGAYGFDLSPVATRHAEFVQIAAEAKAEREMVGRLRRRATIARKAIAQILETVVEYGFGGEEWARLRLEHLLGTLNTAPKPAENCGHSIPTEPPAYHEHDTVIADTGCKPTQGVPASNAALQGGTDGPARKPGKAARRRQQRHKS